jgi:hypothetical protein
MKLPEPKELYLAEAARYVMRQCGVNEPEAREAIVRALADYELRAGGSKGKKGHSWEWIEGSVFRGPREIDWDKSVVRWRQPGADWWSELHGVQIDRPSIDWWVLKSNPDKRAEPGEVPPAEVEPVDTTDSPYSNILPSGAPGRPTSMHLIWEEFARRMGAGEVLPKLVDEGSALAAWLRQAHPHATPPTPKTIQNNIRSEFNRYKVAVTPLRGPPKRPENTARKLSTP